MSSSIRRIATRVAFVAAFSQLIATACDPTAPEDPNDKKTLAAEASLTVPVSSLTASVVSWNEIDLIWPTIGGVNGYQIFRSTIGAGGLYTQVSTTAANVSRYASVGLSGSTQYCYQVRSFKNTGKNTSYGAFSSPACATTLPPPIKPPSEIYAIPQGNSIRVSWKDNSENEDGFRVEQYMTGAEAFNVPANTTFTYFSAVLTEQVLCFRVWAFNAVASLPSTTSDCTVLPAGPTNLEARALDAQSIAVTWTDNSGWEDGYKVSRSEQGGVWTDIATLVANAVSYTDRSVTRDVSYTYRVQALKDGGYSKASNDAIGVIPTSVPAAPLDVYVGYSRGPDWYPLLYLSIAWIDASSNEAGFRIEISSDGWNPWGVWAVTEANATSVGQWIGTEEDPPAGCFRVIAFNAMGDSQPSNDTCAGPSAVTASFSRIPGTASGARSSGTVVKNRATSTKQISTWVPHQITHTPNELR